MSLNVECAEKLQVQAEVSQETKPEPMSGSEDERICRYCLDGDGELIAPCNCKGGSKWVHYDCLRKWQRMAQVNKAAHPWYQSGQSEHQTICGVCKHPFDVKAPSFDEVLQGFTGEQIVNQVCEGHMIVTTLKCNEQWETDLASNDVQSIHNSLEPWVGGVYLIIGISIRGKHEGQDRVVAVRLGREAQKLPKHCMTHCARIVGTKKVQLHHMSPGPSESLHAIGCLRATSKQFVEDETALKILDYSEGFIVVGGSLKSVVDNTHEDWVKENEARTADQEPLPDRKVYVCWGESTWSRTQLIEQLAKGMFGMALFKGSDIFKVEAETETPAVTDLFMSIHDANRCVAPEENELSRAHEDLNEAEPFEDTEAAQEHRRKLRAQLLAANRPQNVGRPQSSSASEAGAKKSFDTGENENKDLNSTAGQPIVE